MTEVLDSKIEYYDGSKILSLTDKNGEIPGWRIITGNRSSGKTTYFYRRAMERFLKKGRQTLFIYRYKYEIENVYPKVFKPIEYWYDRQKMSVSKPYKEGYSILYYGGKVFGFAISLKSCQNLKGVSNLFNDVDEIIWDEFQVKNSNYLTNEMDCFSIAYESIARGPNELVRFVPCIAISNFVSMLNPLMTSLNVYQNVSRETKFLRGDGFVLEQNINIEAAAARNENPVLRAIKRVESPEAVYLMDNTSNIKRLKCKNRYFLTLLAHGKEYGIRFYDNGLVGCSKSVDKNCNICYTIDMEYVDNRWTVNRDVPMLRKRFMDGKFVFQDLECRQAIIDFLKF